MLTAQQIAALRDAASKITDPINDYLIQDIARRIAEAGQLTSTAAYQVWRMQQLGKSQREFERELRRLLQQSRKQIRKILHQSAQSGYGLDINRFPTSAAIPFEKNAALQQIVSAAVELAQEDFTNIVQTIGFVNPFGKPEPLTSAYITSCDFAFKQVVTGAASYTEAIRQATRNLAAKGVRVIDYESGVHTSLEAAVRRNIMGGLGLMQEQISQQVHDDLGCDGWEITAHANSAPDHEPIQGRQYSDAAYAALNGSLRRRIGTLNCGHAAFPIILGVNAPQHTQAELEKFRSDNEKGVTVDGVHYTGYQATQMQRSLERAIRAQKRKVMVDEAAGDGEKLAQDKTKLALLHQRYEEFSKAAGLRTQYERTEAAGFGERKSTDTIAAAPQGPIVPDGEVFDPEAARNSLLKRLENSSGIADNITVLRYYAEHTDLMEDRSLHGPIAYDHVADVIRYNPDIPMPAGADRDGIFAHELAHRSDYLMYHAAENQEWQDAIRVAGETLGGRGAEIEAWFSDGGKYENDAFLSDIISALSRNAIAVPYGHPTEYWDRPLTKEREIFANLMVISAVGSSGADEIDRDLKLLHKIFSKMVLRGDCVK